MKICPICEKEITGSSIGIGGFGLVCVECGKKYIEDQKKMIDSICKL